MTDASWTVVTLEADGSLAEGLADWLREGWGVEPVAIERPFDARCWLEVYLDDPVRAGLLLQVAQGRADVRAVRSRRTGERDWEVYWRRHLHTVRVGRLAIVPEGEALPAPLPADARVVRLLPGPSFGTGDHFTTRFCLEALDAFYRKAPRATLLDVGTGSGILALAAAALGAPRARGIDNDALALDHARKNAALNQAEGRVEFALADATHPSSLRASGSEAPAEEETFDVVCANLYAGLLLALAPVLARCARRSLVLSGIREAELDAVAEAFLLHDGREVVRDGDGEWGGMVFDFAAESD